MIDEQIIIQKLKDLNYDGGENFTLSDYAYRNGSPLDLIMYSKVFWPDFIEFEGMVFPKMMVEDEEDKQKVLDYLIETKGDKRKVEQSFNMIEIPSFLFGKKRAIELADEHISFTIAKILCETWFAKLSKEYSDKNFIFKILIAEEAGDEMAIMFYQS